MALTHPSYTIDTTFTAKNIVNAASVYTFTAAASAKVQFIVKLTNAAGAGDYIAYLTHQWLGTGAAAVMLPKTTATAAAGETVIEFISLEINVKATDVVDVYIDGLATDSSVNGNIRVVADNPSVFDPAADTVVNVTNLATYTGNTKQTGDAYARLTGTVEPAINLNTSIISPVGGTTTSDGAVDGTTVLDTGRTEATNHWNNLAVQITSGVCSGQSRTIKAFTHDVGFTLNAPFTAQIVTGVTYRVVAAIVYQPGIIVGTDSSPLIEPDTLMHMAAMVITNNGQPATGDLAPGVIEIRRVRAGVETTIVAGAACSIATGDIYYDYTFPSASWAAGDLYVGLMTGQAVTVNGIVYPLSLIVFQGRVSREVDILTDTAEIGAAGAGLTALGDTRIANLDATVSSRSTVAQVNVVLARIGAFAGSGLNTILGFLRAMARKTAALTPSDMGGTFNNVTDSLEAIRDKLTSATITVTGPVVTSDGDVVTYRGDTYLNEDGRALEWESDDWPGLTGGSVKVIINKVAEFVGTVVTPAGTVKVRLELTATQSRSIPVGRWTFQVVATQSDGDVATLVDAAWVSRARSAV